MKQTALIAASLLVLALGPAAHAMSTVTAPTMGGAGNSFNPTAPAPTYEIMRNPNGPDAVTNPYINEVMPYAPMGNAYLYGESYGQRRGQFLNIDPFDPNSIQNNFDRGRYANPFQYDPLYNPYGQGSSPYAPRGAGRVSPGRGMPYGR